MVRNTMSMQNLRSNMADLNLSSGLTEAPQATSTAPQTPFDSARGLQTLGSRPSRQLLGNDPHTKALMNRVATGEATQADIAEFNDHVGGLYGQSNAYTPPSNNAQAQACQVETEHSAQDHQWQSTPCPQESETCLPETSWPDDPTYPQSPRPSRLDSADHDKPALHDYYLGLQLLEQQNNKRRILAAQRQELSNVAPPAQMPPAQMPSSQASIAFPSNTAVGCQQTWPSPFDLASCAGSMSPAGFPASQQAMSYPSPPTIPQDYQIQLMLLEQQNKRRLALAQQEPVNIAFQPQMPSADTPLTRVPSAVPASKAPGLQSGRPPNAPLVTASGYHQVMSGPRQANTHEQQDYQMQLMLLEQQNKKRLKLARQEQDQMTAVEDLKSTANPSNEAQYSTGTEPLGLARRKVDVEGTYLNALQKQQDLMDKQRDSAQWPAAGVDYMRFPTATKSAAEVYCQPFCDFLTNNPTVFHAVDSTKKDLRAAGWTELSERVAWDIKTSGRYFVERNGSSLIAFVVGANYEPGNGAAILAGHVDALTAKLKPVSEVPNKAGYLQLGVAPYAGAMSDTWWDRDLGIGGRVLIKKGNKIVTELVKLDWPIARIPTLAPHFGAASQGPFNKETQMTPIIGLEGVDSPPIETNGANAAFVSKQPPALVRAIGNALGLSEQTYKDIVSWELELFDVQPATVGGLNKEFIYGGRIDDKLCSWAAMQALTGSSLYDTRFSSTIKVVAWFDDEEIGSQLRQGARSNFLPQVLERAVGSLSKHNLSSDLMGRTYANSFILSSDVTHAVNPNFLGAYLDNHAPKLNTGLVVAADSNGHMTTDAVSSAILQRCADRVGATLQVFQIRNDSRSGGTVGPMLSSMTGIRAIDAGLPQLSMHSIRATTGSLDPGLGVICFTAFLNGFEHVDKEFRSDNEATPNHASN